MTRKEFKKIKEGDSVCIIRDDFSIDGWKILEKYGDSVYACRRCLSYRDIFLDRGSAIREVRRRLLKYLKSNEDI